LSFAQLLLDPLLANQLDPKPRFQTRFKYTRLSTSQVLLIVVSPGIVIVLYSQVLAAFIVYVVVYTLANGDLELTENKYVPAIDDLTQNDTVIVLAAAVPHLRSPQLRPSKRC